MNKKSQMSLLVSIVTMVLIPAATFAVPGLIHFQGQVAVNGEPFGSSGPENGLFWFAMMDGGHVLQWSSDGNSTPVDFVEISVENGLFQVVLGDAGIMQPFSAGLFSNSELYLKIWFDDGESGLQELEPSLQMAGSGYALNTDTLDGEHASGYVEISGATMTGPLHVNNQAVCSVEGVTYHMVPQGIVILWSGSLDSIPAGWQLCDGTNGAPDLTERFILGCRDGENPGETGGADYLYLSTANLPSHRHSYTTSEDGDHYHSYEDNYRASGTTNTGGLAVREIGFPDEYGNPGESRDTSSDGSHSHSSTLFPTGSGSAFDNRPAFYKLAYIIKME